MNSTKVYYHVYTKNIYTCKNLNPKTAVMNDGLTGGFFVDTRNLMTKHWVKLGEL